MDPGYEEGDPINIERSDMRRAALHNLGCKVNSYETEAMQEMLMEAGYTIVPFQEEADVYVINTCSVTNMADAKSRQMIHRARKKNPEAIVVATGCYVQASAKEAASDPAIDIVIGNNKKTRLVQAIDDFYRRRERIREVDPEDPQLDYEQLRVSRAAEHTRAFIKVQDGCNQFCSDCIIPLTRGRIRSRSPEDILAEARDLAALGYQELVLNGIHLSSYGMTSYNRQVASQEMAGGGHLIELIEAVAELDGIKRIRIGSMEPRLVDSAFARRLARVDKVCPHFHLSLQSGCDDTLRRMNRKYTTEEFRQAVRVLRENFDHPAITTDVIVGFPQETEEEFETSRRFLEEIGFYEMHIFKYSRRRGTVADQMPGQVDEMTKTERSHILLSLADRMSADFRIREIGRQTEALMETRERICGEDYWTGFTGEYVRVAVRADERDLGNRLVPGRLGNFIGETQILCLEEA